MEYLSEDLNVAEQKIKNLEMQVSMHMDSIQQLTESLKETQRYLVKLAHNQMDLTKRISQWPYIVVKEDGGETF